MVFGDGREYEAGSSSSSMVNDSRAASASPAPDARTEELSLMLFGLCFSAKSAFPQPAVVMAELAARSGINLSPEYETVVLVDFERIGAFLVRGATGVLHPVPVRAKSETPSSRACRGV